MKTEDYLNDFISREKQTELNPYLSTRIMTKIESPAKKRQSALQYFVLAGSISLVITVGILIGNIYSPVSQHYSKLNINDSEIENFGFFNTNSNE